MARFAGPQPRRRHRRQYAAGRGPAPLATDAGHELHKQGKHEAALQAYEEALRIDPNFAPAREARDALLNAEAAATVPSVAPPPLSENAPARPLSPCSTEAPMRRLPFVPSRCVRLMRLLSVAALLLALFAPAGGWAAPEAENGLPESPTPAPEADVDALPHTERVLGSHLPRSLARNCGAVSEHPRRGLALTPFWSI